MIRKGRPKMTMNQHLGVKDELTMAEMKELLIRMYTERSPDDAKMLLRRFQVERLRELPKDQWPRFFRIAKNLLDPAP